MKKSIIIRRALFVLLIFIFVVLLVVNIRVFYQKTNQSNLNYNDDVDDKTLNHVEDQQEKTQKRVSSNRLFYTVSSLIEKFVNTCQMGTGKTDSKLGETYSTEEINQQKEYRASIILKLLDSDYVNQQKINDKNINQVISEYENMEISIKSMNVFTNLDKDQYAIYGVGTNLENKQEIKDLFFILNLDTKNETFSIIPLDRTKVQKLDNISLSGFSQEIVQNEYNQVTYVQKTDEDIAKEYFAEYKKLSLDGQEQAYALLDAEYKNKRFGSFERYREYIKDNYAILTQMTIQQYLVENHEGYKLYVCKDNYQNLYIFQEKYPMDFVTRLDTYTLPTEKFKEQYEKGTVQTKVQMNIDKFRLMINNQDYKSAYSVLSEGFKNNYFKTQEDFEKYVTENAYRYNEIKFESFEKQGNTYICKAYFSDLTKGKYQDESKGTGGSGYIYDWNFIVQLGEDLEFTLSFEVK